MRLGLLGWGDLDNFGIPGFEMLGGMDTIELDIVYL
jgi:hypothetical protein